MQRKVRTPRVLAGLFPPPSSSPAPDAAAPRPGWAGWILGVAPFAAELFGLFRLLVKPPDRDGCPVLPRKAVTFRRLVKAAGALWSSDLRPGALSFFQQGHLCIAVFPVD